MGFPSHWRRNEGLFAFLNLLFFVPFSYAVIAFAFTTDVYSGELRNTVIWLLMGIALWKYFRCHVFAVRITYLQTLNPPSGKTGRLRCVFLTIFFP